MKSLFAKIFRNGSCDSAKTILRRNFGFDITFSKGIQTKKQKSYSINVNISIKFTHDLNLAIFVVNDVLKANKFCFTNSLVTWYFDKQSNNFIKATLNLKIASKECYRMIIQGIQENSYIHVHVILLICIRCRGIRKNGHFCNHACSQNTLGL